MSDFQNLPFSSNLFRSCGLVVILIFVPFLGEHQGTDVTARRHGETGRETGTAGRGTATNNDNPRTMPPQLTPHHKTPLQPTRSSSTPFSQPTRTASSSSYERLNRTTPTQFCSISRPMSSSRMVVSQPLRRQCDGWELRGV